MSQLNISNIVQLLRDDLSKVSSLSFELRSDHLQKVSKPLLKTLFQTLSKDIKIEDAQQTSLCDCLIEYMGYDRYTAVEATMCLFRLRDLSENLTSKLGDKVDALLDLQSSKADRYKIVKILSQLFTFDPILASEIFNKNAAFANLLANEVTLLSNEFESPSSETWKHLNNILMLFSNACVDEISRSLIASMYINLLLKCLRLDENDSHLQIKCYATTITVKMWRMIKPDILANNSQLLSLDSLSEISLSCLSKGMETSIECLSLLSTNIQIKNKLRNANTLDTLVELLKKKEHTKYGIISLLSSITIPNRVLKIKQRSVMTLKDSNSIDLIDIHTNEKLEASRLNDDIQKIRYVCKELIAKGFFSSYLVSIFKSLESSKGLIGECIKLMHNVVFPDIDPDADSRDQLNDDKGYYDLYIKEFTQIIRLLTAYLIGTSQNMKYSHETFITFADPNIEIGESDLESRSIAIKALTSPEISGNVNGIYGGHDLEFSLSPVPFIIEILIQHDIDIGMSNGKKATPFSTLKKQVFSSFDVYYAFIALAAIASIGHEQIKQTIFTLGFDSIMNTLHTDEEKLQFASLQLLNEICDLPLCVAKFFNWNTETDEYYQNFKVLTYLIQSTNYESQCLALQIFYATSRFEIVSEKLANNELFCKVLNSLFHNQNSDDALTYYALLVLSNILPLNKKLSDNKLSIFNESKSAILSHINSENEQIQEITNTMAHYLS